MLALKKRVRKEKVKEVQKRQVIEENNQNLSYNVVPVALLSYVLR